MLSPIDIIATNHATKFQEEHEQRPTANRFNFLNIIVYKTQFEQATEIVFSRRCSLFNEFSIDIDIDSN